MVVMFLINNRACDSPGSRLTMLWNTSSPFIFEMPTGAAGLLSIQRAFQPHKNLTAGLMSRKKKGGEKKKRVYGGGGEARDKKIDKDHKENLFFCGPPQKGEILT